MSLVLALSLSVSSVALAASTPAKSTTTPAAAQQQTTVNQAYGVTGNVQQGMIVQLDPKNPKNVAPLTNNPDIAMQGVVVAANESAVSLSGDGTSQQVYVATNGTYQALVSNQNGPIKPGDLISISAIDGIGMKADTTQSVILGKAAQGFNGTNMVSGTAELNTSTGKLKVAIGLISVNIDVSRNPLAPSGTDSKVPNFLRKLAESIAGHPVDAARIYISLVLLFVTMIIAGSLLLGGVRSSLISVGRNPLARSAVLKGLIQVLFVGIVVFVLGLASIYLLLKA